MCGRPGGRQHVAGACNAGTRASAGSNAGGFKEAVTATLTMLFPLFFVCSHHGSVHPNLPWFSHVPPAPRPTAVQHLLEGWH